MKRRPIKNPPAPGRAKVATGQSRDSLSQPRANNSSSNNDPLPGNAIRIDLNRQLLNRYRYIEHEGLRLLAGWLPKVATFELKCELGRTIWEGALHVNAFYLRLREIQSPAFQPPSDQALVTLMAELRHAPDEFGLVMAYYRVVVPNLIQALAQHEHATFPNSDLPSVHAIKHALLDLRALAERMQPILVEAEKNGRITTSAHAWENYIRELLAAAGGASGLDPRRGRAPVPPAGRQLFTPPHVAARDDRFSQRGADFAEMPPEEAYHEHTVEEFERYSTEMLAAETVALVLFSVSGMPWEFEFDTARHLYDEVRHCLMGYEWMRRHAMNPFESPQYLHVYAWRSQFSPVMQYCLLTMGNEVHAFPYRHRRVEAHQQSGDQLSEQFVRYDIADETQHVRFGKRWLPELLKATGERRTLDEYTADVLKVWASEYRTGKLTINVE